jgi:hypothetical protein
MDQSLALLPDVPSSRLTKATSLGVVRLPSVGCGFLASAEASLGRLPVVPRVAPLIRFHDGFMDGVRLTSLIVSPLLVGPAR